MIKDNGATSKQDELSSKVVQFQDPIENLHRTLNLFRLPEDMASNTKSLNQIHSKIDDLQNFIARVSDNIELGDRYMTTQEAKDYLGMSDNTFDKYRYKTKIKIKGYLLDGVYRFKKSDLDRFMLTYDAKSSALA
jgi:paraquat-inducible protein B